MTQKRSPRAGAKAQPAPSFKPVRLRYRHDGWTPERQVAFIRALAECGCVRDACRRVGMSAESAYALVSRPDAQSFRVAWEIALTNAVRLVADAAFSRAINGVAVPHYYKGELVGEHRRYNDRLAMFILRYHDPHRYGRHLDQMVPKGHAEQRALLLGDAIACVHDDAVREAKGLPRQVVTNLGSRDDEDEEEARLAPADTGAEEDDLDDELDGEDASPLDVASGSSTSGRSSHKPRSPLGQRHDRKTHRRPHPRR